MTQPLTPLQPRQKQQNVKLQMSKMDSGVIQCVQCDKVFTNPKDLANHLAAHAVMEKKVDVQSSFDSLKNTKMQVLLTKMNLPIKRQHEGFDEKNPKRIKIQDGANELSVNCNIDKLSCKICKPKKNFKTPEVLNYHMVTWHGDNTITPMVSSTAQPLAISVECITPSKTKVRVKSQASTVEIVDMTEESPIKPVMDSNVLKKLKSLTCTSVSLCDPVSLGESNGDLKSEPEESFHNSKLGKFSSSMQVRLSTKKGGLKCSKAEVNGGEKVKTEPPSNSVKLKFKEYIAADSESDFEIPDEKSKDFNKNKTTTDNKAIYEKVSTVIDKVLSHKISIQPPATSIKPSPSCLQKISALSIENPTDHNEFTRDSNGVCVKSPRSIDGDGQSQMETTPALDSSKARVNESPRTKSGRRVVKTKRLVSTDSVCNPSPNSSKIREEPVNPVTITPHQISSMTVSQETSQFSSEFGLESVELGPAKTSSTSSKSKVNSDSDCYKPEIHTSDSATANSDVEFALPLRKSSRVRGPKPPQIRDPIENPAPKPKRRLSERKFEGAKPFKCNHCPLSYSNLEDKKIHEQTHEEKTFQCVYCDMRFTVEFSLKKHTRIHKT